MILWDYIQQVQIENLKARQGAGEWAAEHSLSRDAALDQKVERLSLVAEAMWELLSERSGITMDDLLARVRAIDARDGKVDAWHGITPDGPVVRCAACQAVVPVGKTRCQFCGAEVPGAKADPFKV